MINYVYALKNKKSGNFGKPLFEVIPDEAAAEAFTVSFKEAPESESERIKELELYYIGKFDTKTGVLQPIDPVFILDGGTCRG